MNSIKEKIYLLPGLMCNEALWQKLYEYLDEHFELIHVPVPNKKSVEEMAKALSNTLPNEPVNLLGFSLGGYLASYFAITYPSRIKRLCILACSSCALSMEEVEKRKEVLILIEKYGFKGLSRKKVQTLLEEKNQDNDELINIIQEMYIQLGKEAFEAQVQGTLYREDLLEPLLKLTQPVLFYYGENDRLVNAPWLKEIAQHKPEWIKVEAQSYSHMLPLEKPLEVSHTIDEWMNTAIKTD